MFFLFGLIQRQCLSWVAFLDEGVVTKQHFLQNSKWAAHLEGERKCVAMGTVMHLRSSIAFDYLLNRHLPFKLLLRLVLQKNGLLLLCPHLSLLSLAFFLLLVALVLKFVMICKPPRVTGSWESCKFSRSIYKMFHTWTYRNYQNIRQKAQEEFISLYLCLLML